MKSTKIVCDNCEKDLTEVIDGYDVYRLSLNSQEIYNTSDISFGRTGPSLIEREHHFCNIGCLKKWINNLGK